MTRPRRQRSTGHCPWIFQYVEGQPPVALKNAGAYAQAKVEKKKQKETADDLGPPMD